MSETMTDDKKTQEQIDLEKVHDDQGISDDGQATGHAPNGGWPGRDNLHDITDLED